MSAGEQPGAALPSTTAAGAPSLREELWSFALAFYGRPEVSKACLVLQERIGADVDIILFCLFARLRQGVSLRADDLAAIDALVADWRAEIVQPLRRLRTRLKSGPPPAPSGPTDELRDRIKSIELEAERIELDRLADWLALRGARHEAPAADLGESLGLVLGHFAAGARARDDDPQIRDALRILADAANEFAAETSPSPA